MRCQHLKSILLVLVMTIFIVFYVVLQAFALPT